MCQGSPLVSQSLRASFYQILRCLADLMRILNRHKGIKHVWCWNLRQVDIIGRNPFGRAVFFLGTVEVAESITVIQVVVSEAEQLFDRIRAVIFQASERGNTEAAILNALGAPVPWRVTSAM